MGNPSIYQVGVIVYGAEWTPGGEIGGEKILGGKNFWEGYLWDSEEKLVGG